MIHKLHPCLWFNGNAKEAATFYCSLFSNAAITTNTPMVVKWNLEDLTMMGLNGGPMFTMNPSISIFVTCESKQEIETLYEQLSQDGKTLMPLDTYPWSEKYAWVQDRFGLTWQLMLGQIPEGSSRIIPSFLFAGEVYGKALEAIHWYASIFTEAQVHTPQLYQKEEAQPEGYLKFGHFSLNQQLFGAMDGFGAHDFKFNEGISLVVECDTQVEIDYYWEALTKDGGAPGRCGWLKDRFGISWQIIPAQLGKIMSNPANAGRAMKLLMTMNKLDIAALENA